MATSVPYVSTITPDSWIQASWEDFLTFAEDPTLSGARCYYDQGYMRIEMSPLGSAHGQDNSIISTVGVLYSALKGIPIKELTNTTFRKAGIREAQPDLAYYIGDNLQFPPRTNEPVDLNQVSAPTLVVEISASSLSDDSTRKQLLYQRLGVQEYWVIDVKKATVLAKALPPKTQTPLLESRVLTGLTIELLETALRRSQKEDDGAIARWLMDHI